MGIDKGRQMAYYINNYWLEVKKPANNIKKEENTKNILYKIYSMPGRGKTQNIVSTGNAYKELYEQQMCGTRNSVGRSVIR